MAIDLCLEYREDNWHPDLNGAVMLRSALKLMAADLGITHTSGWALPSAHHVTDGQQICGNWCRMNMTAAGQVKLGSQWEIEPARRTPRRQLFGRLAGELHRESAYRLSGFADARGQSRFDDRFWANHAASANLH
ncbi:hypothetical protein E9536_40585 [Burkholderia sp. LS-044]|uniref:hypothetical protein n=1 Tax=Burkholderia sp. LS-044 TaxID=1459967 RepID=UPI0010A690B1|nr:hypothetical protein [Burkholderia sp. LS-044]THJ45986.1 hypothetical protein E9536_40585 [Burkholderia sp. LS-044]